MPSGEILTPDTLDFAIDPDVFRTRDGRLRLTVAIDFVEGERLGTGLGVAYLNENLTRLVEEPRVLARASDDWQIFDAKRSMPWKEIPGIHWGPETTVCWHCIEGPASINERLILYSGGSFEKAYGIGVLEYDEQHAVWRDLSRNPGARLLEASKEKGLYTPGHCSVVTGPEGALYMLFHARFGDPSAVRQMALAPLTCSA